MKPVLSIVLMVLLIFQRGSGLSVLREDGGSGVFCFDKECNDENSSIDGIEYEGEKGEYICVDYQDRKGTTAAPTTPPTTAAPTTAAPTPATTKTAAPTTAAPTTAAPTTAAPTPASPTTAAPTTAAPTTAAPTTAAPTPASPTTAAPTTAAPTTAAPTTAAPTPAGSTTDAPETTTPAVQSTTDHDSPNISESLDSDVKSTEGLVEEKHVHKIFRLKNVLTKGNLMDGDEKKQCALKPKEGKICDVIKHYYEECTESEPSSGKSISVGFSLFVILVFSVLFLE